ncbi:MAG: PQQ-dependent sugar dehydrogenase [Planctomycetota bacterium]
MKLFLKPVVALFLSFLLSTAASALPPNFVDQPVADNWNQAVGLTFDSSGRLIVWEKAGRAWIVQNGVKSNTPLIDISEEVGDWRDYGMLGFSLDPNFDLNGYIYLLYVVDYHHVAFFGTPSYDPQADWYFRDTIARLTRYTATAGSGFSTVDYNSRLALIGESISTGFPICHQSHGIGSLVFGEDGTLLISCGDAASYSGLDVGGCRNGSSCTCVSDGIMSPKEDVGAYRSQLVDSLNGKILRINPANGDGVPSNPFYNAAQPRSARSRVWAMGLRNPFRTTLRPGTGRGDPALGDPGSVYIGDVGWYSWEELSVAKGPGANLGWPAFEGLKEFWGYYRINVSNLDAPNPLFGTTPPGQGFCNQQYFYFRDLIVQETLNPLSFPNPCDPNQQIPVTVDRFEHTRPPIDWGHGGPSRTGIFNGAIADVINLDDPGSPVPGPWFPGNSSTGGAWYTGSNFPVEYQGTYFQGDFGAGWIRNFVFDADDNPVEVRDFAGEGNGSVVAIAADPVNDGLYYIAYDQAGCCMVRKILYAQNVPPVAVARGMPVYGPAPLSVQFTGSESTDPDGTSASLSHAWNFGDGTPISVEANPVHIYPTEDITNLGTFIGQIFSLSPPNPIGGGNWDPEVMRDGDYPPVGNQDSSRQYDTYHGGSQGNLDWIGYSFPQPRQFTGLVFQEGKHFFDGGWFDALQLQVRSGLVWNTVNVNPIPTYAGNNGITFETYEYAFAPITGDAIRIYGQPGGSADFISVGELRVLAVPPVPLTAPTRFDVTLTVTDSLGAPSSASLAIYVNDTPPNVAITNPPNGATYFLTEPILIPLTADISDAEHGHRELTCEWQTLLHHDEHIHPEPPDSNCTTQTVISPHGGGPGEEFFFEIVLTVTDPLGLSTTVSSFVYPELPIACTIDADCDDSNECTQNQCVNNLCAFSPVSKGATCDDGNLCTVNDACVNRVCDGQPIFAPFGDFDLTGLVDLDDLLCLLNEFLQPGSCSQSDIFPCGGNGVLDLDDVVAFLEAFANNPLCPSPCP